MPSHEPSVPGAPRDGSRGRSLEREGDRNPVSVDCVRMAHLSRDVERIWERGGLSRAVGEGLRACVEAVFGGWHAYRAGRVDEPGWQRYIGRVREQTRRLLERGAKYGGRAGPDGAAGRPCAEILKVEPALWLFAREAGVEPTNNAAERALRQGVVWRRTSYGSASESGSEFVARMLTVRASLLSQGRNLYEYLRASCEAARRGEASPELVTL